MLLTLLIAVVTCVIDVVSYVTGRFELRGHFYWLKDSEGSVIIPFQYDFDHASESTRMWLMMPTMWCASTATISAPLLYYYGANRFRASGWAVSWANLVCALTGIRVILLSVLSYLFHAKLLQELAQSEERLNLGEIFALYKMKIIGVVPLCLTGNIAVSLLLFGMLLLSLKETREWRRLNVRKIY